MTLQMTIQDKEILLKKDFLSHVGFLSSSLLQMFSSYVGCHFPCTWTSFSWPKVGSNWSL